MFVFMTIPTMLAYHLLSLCTTVTGDMSGFIVGGKQANIKDWPFITYLLAEKGDKPISACGGSLISSQTVLTAAHCLDDVTDKKKYFDKINYAIFMGHRAYKKATLRREVLDYKTHDEYDPVDVYYDIGIMFLTKPVEFSATVKKVLLMNKEMFENMDGEGELTVAGWGRYGEYSPGSEHLKSLEQTLIDQDLCYSYINEETPAPGIVCGSKRRKVNATEYAFSGDSGGPLARQSDQYLVGLVSWRMESHGVTVYTSVPYFYDWIRDTQAELFQQCCPSKI